jgi:hypothetical protein
MKIYQLKNNLFIQTPSGCYMVDTENKSAKRISEESFTLIEGITELLQAVKEIK